MRSGSENEIARLRFTREIVEIGDLPVRPLQIADMLKACGEHGVEAISAASGHHLRGVSRRIGYMRVLQIRLKAVEFVFWNYVYDARDRVGAVQSGRAIEHHVHALNRDQRYQCVQ